MPPPLTPGRLLDRCSAHAATPYDVPNSDLGRERTRGEREKLKSEAEIFLARKKDGVCGGRMDNAGCYFFFFLEN
jgi:hypothetical protein